MGAEENAKNVVEEDDTETSDGATQKYQFFFAVTTILPLILLYTSPMFSLSFTDDLPILAATGIAGVFALYVAYSELTDNVIKDGKSSSNKVDRQLEARYQSIFHVNIAFILIFCVLAFRWVISLRSTWLHPCLSLLHR